MWVFMSIRWIELKWPSVHGNFHRAVMNGVDLRLRTPGVVIDRYIHICAQLTLRSYAHLFLAIIATWALCFPNYERRQIGCGPIIHSILLVAGTCNALFCYMYLVFLQTLRLCWSLGVYSGFSAAHFGPCTRDFDSMPFTVPWEVHWLAKNFCRLYPLYNCMLQNTWSNNSFCTNFEAVAQFGK